MSEKFEHKVKQLLDEVSFQPRQAVWEKLRRDLHPDKKRRRFIYWWLLPLALAGGAVVYFSGNNSSRFAHKGPVSVKAERPGSHPPARQEAPVLEPAPVVPGPSPGSNHPPVSTTPGRDEKNLLTLKPKPATVHQSNSEVRPNRTEPVQSSTTSQVVAEEDTTRAASFTVANIPETGHDTTGLMQQPDTLSTEGALPVIVNTSDRKWKLAVSVEAGFSRLTGGLGLGQQKELMAGPPGSTGSGGFTSPQYQRSSYGSRPVWGLGLSAEKALNDRLKFRAGMAWQQLAFTVTQGVFQDSVSAGLMNTYMLRNEYNHFRFQSLRLSTLFSYSIYRQQELDLALAAGLDNQFLLAARHRQQVTAGGAVLLQEKSLALTEYRRWQPQFNLQMVMQLQAAKGRSLQLIPWFRYGLRGLEKDSHNRKNHLVSYGLGVNYFFR